MTWKPVNPCTPDCKGRDSYCPPRNRFGCEDFKIYQGGIDAQRKLLEYMDEPCDNPAHLVDNRDRVDASRVAVIPLPTGKYKASYLHRKDCPQCMAELKESEK
jgi:hypothetical protein